MHKRICPICEAACGLVVSADGREVTAIEPNRKDVFSKGHACAKGIALKDLDQDPQRLRTPLVRENDEFREASFEEAYAIIQKNLTGIRDHHGANSIATYIGNPTAHNIGLALGLGVFLGQLRSTNIYSAGSVDQLPKQLASELMFGNDMAIPVPDIERGDFILMLGANPAVSNGSLWVVPKFREKLRTLQNRGGQLWTIDPRRSETARLADRHFFIRPGTDAWLLAGIITALLDFGVEMPDRYSVSGWLGLKNRIEQIELSAIEKHTGIDAESVRSMAAALANAESAAVYGRVGTTLQKHGTLTSFLIEVVNLLTGNLDKEGGAMFPEQPYATPAKPDTGLSYDRFQSRVSGYPEVLGQMPVVALAEEIETPGEGQIKALVSFAGNPVVSNPDSYRLERALDQLEFMVAIDIYENETTRHADVILPGTSPFEDSYYASFLGSMGYRNAARYSPPIFPSDAKREWNLGLTLGYLLNADAPPNRENLREFEDSVVAASVAEYTNDESSPLHGRDMQEILGMVGPEEGVERLLDLGIRAGRWGDQFGGQKDGLTLQKLIDAPDGTDLGAIRSERLGEVVKTPDGHINLSPPVLMEDLARLVSEVSGKGFQLIGRRSAATNNSWLHNLPTLTRGKHPCSLHMNREDAHELGIGDDGRVELDAGNGKIVATVTRTDDLARGVVSLPHGFSETDLVLSNQRKGPNYNSIIATSHIDAPSGTAALNGVSVAINRVDS